MSISTAVSSARVSRTSGYGLKKGFFSNAVPNLPQKIVMLGEANDANQSGLVTTPVQITSAAQAGTLYGYGSPIHQMARILFPISGGDLMGGIPVFVMAQAAASGSPTATIQTYTVSGSPSGSATHSMVINGRYGVDFQNYSYSVISTDTPTTIAAKQAAAINAVLGAPVTATSSGAVLTVTTKWKSATSAALNVSFDTSNGGAVGVTYASTSNTAGTGAADISGAVAQFTDQWYTTVINPYGTATLAALEALNGIPDNTNPTGQYSPTIFRPFMAFFGNTSATVSALTAITDADARKSQVTNVLCPAPNSAAMGWEAAANMVALFAPIAQNTPHLDVEGESYPDMPVGANNGDLALYNNRDLLVQAGCSTVTLKNGAYEVQDLVTTYHPAGEVPLQYSYCRNLNIDWNVKYGYGLLENIYVKNHTIIADNQVSDVSQVVKPSSWKAVLFQYLDDLAANALINNPAFSKASLQVGVSSTNPNRFESSFNYKRTGMARIESTDVYAGF